MRLDFLRSEGSPWRKASALGIIGAFLFTIALSNAPRLHEHFHKALGPDHECAVTMFLSGTCDHSACVTPSTMPPVATATPVFFPRQFRSVQAGLEFSLLEHAPPTFA
jgi:hypothetical protein